MPTGRRVGRRDAKSASAKRAPNTVSYAVLYGSLAVTILLTLLLVVYDVLVVGSLRLRTGIGIGAVAYLGIGWWLAARGRIQATNWMTILLYEAVAFSTLLHWGINTPTGILAICFVILLPGVLLGSAYIFPVAASTIFLLVVVQTIHTLDLQQPQLEALSVKATYWDVLMYATMLVIFSFVSWLSKRQAEVALGRALKAEARLKAQKESVTAELKQESALLRRTRFKHMYQLYQFALIGQSSAATLHELANHLSILNLDIDDLGQQTKNSAAIENAKETIRHINQTVRQARQQLNSCSKIERFNVITTITACAADFSEICKQRQVRFIKEFSNASKPLFVEGSPTALIQAVTVLLNNALQACQDLDEPWVGLSVVPKQHTVEVIVTDSGPGVDDTCAALLFKPHFSTKANGLGVGLYIAQQLVRTHLLGSIRFKNGQPGEGTQFIISLPKSKGSGRQIYEPQETTSKKTPIKRTSPAPEEIKSEVSQ